MAETEILTLDAAQAIVKTAFLAADVPEDVAMSVAKALVAAEAEGQVGHGFSRVADYIAQAKSGKINATAEISVQEVAAAARHINAGCGFAYPALDGAFEVGVPLAQETGIALVSIGNSHHCGALSVQVDRIAEAGLVGIMMANTPKAMAPWGARTPVFGTNPIAFATPRAGGAPLVIDLSLSTVARGKVMAAKKAGREIPLGWALDANGQPTTDPEAGLAGSMVPMGDAKGAALALMVEVLAAALTGSAFSNEAGSFFNADGPAPRVGQVMIFINPVASGDFKDRVGALLDGISAMEGTRLPGDRRRAAILKAEAQGIEVSSAVLAQLRALA